MPQFHGRFHIAHAAVQTALGNQHRPVLFKTDAQKEDEKLDMEAVILIGIQGSGKSTFFKERFFDTHVRVNLDMLKTRRRERLLIEACLTARQPFVIDKMNLTREKRKAYIEQAKAVGFRVVGYFLRSDIEECKQRNRRRPPDQVIPLPGVLRAHKTLEPPSPDEGFDALYRVHIAADGRFVVEKWTDQE